MPAKTAADPLTDNAACGAVLELIVLETLCLSSLAAAMLEDIALCAEGT